MQTKQEILNQYGASLRQALQERSMTEVELAKKLGTQSHAIYAYERGQSDPKMHRVATVARLLGMSVEELVTGKKNPGAKMPRGRVLAADEFNQQLIERLQMMMKLAKTNSTQLQERTGLNSGTIVNVLTGKRQPRLSTVAMIVDGMGANIEQAIPELQK